jgi:5'-phosphate synthase pdxT subunit
MLYFALGLQQLAGLDGLIIPGGESTTLIQLMDASSFWKPLGAFVEAGKSIRGTCAGLILLARDVFNPFRKSLTGIFWK